MVKRSAIFSPRTRWALAFYFLLPWVGWWAMGARAEEPRPVRVAIYSMFPVTFQDDNGVASGFMVEVLQRIADEQHWRLEFIQGTLNEGLERVRTGQAELVVSVAYNEERARYLQYSAEPLLRVWGEVYVREGSPITEFLGLDQCRVAVMQGSNVSQAFTKQIESFNLHVREMEYDSYDSVFAAVKRGEADAGVVINVFGQGRAAAYRLASTGIVFSPYPHYIAAARGGATDLLPVIDAYLIRWKADQKSPYYQALGRWLQQQGQVVRKVPPLLRNALVLLLAVVAISTALALVLRARVRRATEHITASEGRYRQLFAQMMTGFALHEVICDEHGQPVDYRFLAVNQAFEQMTGLKSADLIGRTVLEILPRTEPSWIERYGQVALTGEPTQFEDYSGALGKYFEVRVYSPEHGKFAVLALDVTGQRQAEEARRLSEERLRLAMEASSDALWDWDRVRGTLYWNPRALEMLEYSADAFSVTYEKWLELLHPDDRDAADASWQEQLRHGDSFVLECRLRTASGGYRWILSRGKAVARDEYDEPTRLVGTHADLTERKRAEDERLLLERQVQQSQKLESLGVLAGGIAHDFNNLLTAVLGHAELAQLKLQADSPVRGSLREIEKAAQRAAELCRQMLAYAGKGRFVIEPVNLNELVQEMVQLLGASISKKARMELRLDAELAAIHADATQLRQVLMNLVINASEALGEHEGRITIATGHLQWPAADGELKLHGENPAAGPYVWFEIGDTGCGMDAATQARLFEPFFTTKFTGRGLGMSAVMGIVRGHKGALLMHSEPARGSTFRIMLPVCVQAASWSGSTPARSLDLPTRKTVLLVDDEEVVLRIGKGMLESCGMQVLLAADGREALEICQARAAEIDLVLLDLTMPHMDGIETLQALRGQAPELCVVICSGYSEHDLATRFGTLPLAGFLQKPYSLAALRALLQRVLKGDSDLPAGEAGDQAGAAAVEPGP